MVDYSLFSVDDRLAGFGLFCRAGAIKDAQDFIFAEDQVLLSLDFDLVARILAEQDAIARLDFEGDEFAVIQSLSLADSDDFGFLGFFFEEE